MQPPSRRRPCPALALTCAPLRVAHAFSSTLHKALKLDIDAASVELPFMDAIQADAGLRGRIGEMFFGAWA